MLDIRRLGLKAAHQRCLYTLWRGLALRDKTKNSALFFQASHEIWTIFSGIMLLRSVALVLAVTLPAAVAIQINPAFNYNYEIPGAPPPLPWVAATFMPQQASLDP